MKAIVFLSKIVLCILNLPGIIISYSLWFQKFWSNSSGKFQNFFVPSSPPIDSIDLSSVPKSRDFGHGLRDKILLSWQVTSPWFLEIPRKMGKTHYFSQKYQNFSHFFKKIRDFSAILRFIARDYSDFLGVFLLVIFVTFLPWSRDFQEKSFGNTGEENPKRIDRWHLLNKLMKIMIWFRNFVNWNWNFDQFTKPKNLKERKKFAVKAFSPA